PPLKSIRITSPYGMRRHPIDKVYKFHNGIDLAARYENVYAMFDGIVAEVGSNASAGKFVTLQHGAHLEVTYMHLSRIHVAKGDYVLSGDIVARSGSTGKSSSPHLHIKATYRHRSINPAVLPGL
ncbi:MAG: M23 family metallopeptidase, partial [Muribaculaceae bacterium]